MKCYPHGFGDPRSALQDCPGSSSTTSVCILGLSFGFPVYRPPLACQRQFSSRKAQELGTLCLTLVPAFHFFSVVPDQFPNQARTHSDVLAIEWLLGLATDQIQYAALLPFCRVAVFQVVVTLPTLTSHSSQNALLSASHRYHQTGGCPRLANLEPLPPFPLPLRLIRVHR